jgi:hypothetical protein
LTKRRPYRGLRLFFLVVLVSSLLSLVVGFYSLSDSGGGTESGAEVAGIALLASVASLVGFASTTVLAWRKDRREAAADLRGIEGQRIALERDRLALERERLQLERDKQSDGDPKSE